MHIRQAMVLLLSAKTIFILKIQHDDGSAKMDQKKKKKHKTSL